MGITKLSVNINKIATLRNARGGNIPDVIQAAIRIEEFGADGITVHPRPDERHIRYADVYALKEVIQKELNIEGNPQVERFMKLVLEVKPTQVTLVPDAPDALTSNAGWDTITHARFLCAIVSQLKQAGMRVSVFVDPKPEMIEAAHRIGADRIELYTEPYARLYAEGKAEQAVLPYIEAARLAQHMGLGVNAGHDLNLHNLAYLKKAIPFLAEVSIGHALISDALYYGLENTIQMYLRQLGR